MHEAGAARSIVEAACLVASEREAGICAITVEVDGQAIDPITVELHTRAAAVGTLVEGADVTVRVNADVERGAIRLVSVTLADL